MLDSFSIFTRGGALLWTLQFTALRHSPLEAINALIRGCLLEERSSDATFTYTPKTGAQQSLKWTFHNGLGLVFVAIYQKSLGALSYVDELLDLVKGEFVPLFGPHLQTKVGFKSFDDKFVALLRSCESRADEARKESRPLSKKPPQQQLQGKVNKTSKQTGALTGHSSQSVPGGSSDEPDEDDDGNASDPPFDLESKEGATVAAFDLSKLKVGGGKGAKAGSKAKESAEAPGKSSGSKKGKANRDWNLMGKKTAAKETGPIRLDYTDGDPTDGPDQSDNDNLKSSPGSQYASQQALGVSQMDVEDELPEEEEEEEEDLTTPGASKEAPKAKSVLGSFLNSIALRVVGSESLTEEDLDLALQEMKKRLMERNVAEEIAAAVCSSVSRSLVGKKLASFTGVKAMVKRSFEDALSGILNKRQVDVLLDIRKAQEKGKPYVIVFCGVNGVGKSTNLAKIAYWLGQHGIKVTIAACDTFRAGAVEQLKTHCARLSIPLYERGYEKDPAKVAFEAVKQAEKDGRHVVLVDTAGRMQDNEPLMRAMANLIAVNDPQLVLFVGEALVGNDAVDQLTKFSRALVDLAPPSQSGEGSKRTRGVDGIVLTKFDTIDEKVGAALSMVYSSGAPIMFVGCGQTYLDLKKLNVKSVVNSLLS